MKKTSTFQNALIWFGAGVSLAEILTGTAFAPLGMGKGLLAILIGHVIGCGMMLLAGLIGGRTGRSAMGTVELSFGRIGCLFFAALHVLQLVGWTAIMIYDGALAVGGIFAIGRWVWCLVIGGLIILWIVVGVTDLGWINKITMAALFVLTLVLFKVIFQLSWVPSGSMETTIPEDTLLISWQLPYMVSDPTPQRGDIVTFWSDELGKLLVKRVVGLPGDEITFQDGYTYINGEMLDESYLPRQGITQCSDSFLVPEGCVFFMGDNRTGSNDARFWKQPYISVDNIRAKVMVGISVLPDNSWRGVRVIH